MPHRFTCSARCSCHYFVLPLLLVHSQQKTVAATEGQAEAQTELSWRMQQEALISNKFRCRPNCMPAASCEFPKTDGVNRTQSQRQSQSPSPGQTQPQLKSGAQTQPSVAVAASCRVQLWVCVLGAHRDRQQQLGEGCQERDRVKGRVLWTHTHAPMQALWYRYGDACKCNRILRLCTF